MEPEDNKHVQNTNGAEKKQEPASCTDEPKQEINLLSSRKKSEELGGENIAGVWLIWQAKEVEKVIEKAPLTLTKLTITEGRSQYWSKVGDYIAKMTSLNELRVDNCGPQRRPGDSLDQHETQRLDDLLLRLPSSLQILQIKKCECSDWQKVGEGFAALDNLQQLVISDCYLTDMFLRKISESKKLRRLALRNVIGLDECRTSEQKNGEGNEDGLETAELECQVPRRMLDPLLQIKQLQQLEISAVDRNRTTLNKLDEPEMFLEEILKQLTSLNRLVFLLPELKHLELWNFNNERGLTPDRIKLVAHNLPNLQELNVAKNNLKALGTEYLCQSLRELKMLCIWDCKIGDEGLTHISNYLRNLRYLYIWGNRYTQEGLKRLAKLKSLERLYVQPDKPEEAIAKDTEEILKKAIPMLKIYK